VTTSQTMRRSNAPAWRRIGGRNLSPVEVAVPAPPVAAGRTGALWPDDNQFAHETIREQTRQGGTGPDRETRKLLLRHTTADSRLRDEKALERLRAWCFPARLLATRHGQPILSRAC
jgi:hypothetical protein